MQKGRHRNLQKKRKKEDYSTTHNDLDFYLQEVESLSELPLNRLIQLKSIFFDKNDNEENENITASSRMSSLSLPAALPLRRSDKQPIRRYEEWHEKGEKDTKISKIFQLTITTLSFLAFGGYLLTLIIMAIRRTTTPTAASVILLSNLNKLSRPKRNIFLLDPMENEFDTERMYKGMIMLSRGYALYNQ
ncbi:uncharacterized protein LOC122501550 isoform X2 [Leptopilina heterotoma]|uniref:uncharacterized protein LOC122501550 isoform X2 n=1 Tax=Leptopilina heterotoma TaxID=63436 RepID=UPI001CA9D193|nr:uncharacterized protein LOC122501550 isoform X2 [Leptopilina heterotoma]